MPTGLVGSESVCPSKSITYTPLSLISEVSTVNVRRAESSVIKEGEGFPVVSCYQYTKVPHVVKSAVQGSNEN